MIKTLKKLGIKENFLSLIKDTYENLTDHITLGGGRQSAFPCDQEQDKDVCSYHFYLTL